MFKRFSLLLATLFLAGCTSFYNNDFSHEGKEYGVQVAVKKDVFGRPVKGNVVVKENSKKIVGRFEAELDSVDYGVLGFGYIEMFARRLFGRDYNSGIKSPQENDWEKYQRRKWEEQKRLRGEIDRKYSGDDLN